MNFPPVILETRIREFPLFRRGKVRDVYDLGKELLIVSTDRISCFDVVLPSGIPGKGAVLTAISLFWFDFLGERVAHHLLSADTSRYPAALRPYAEQLAGRSMLVKKSKPLAVECIVRGYLSGSGWKEYRQSRSICGVRLPDGLAESAQLPQPIFTPSTKAEQGHDVNVSAAFISELIGVELTEKLKETSLEIYRSASDYACGRGIIIADTKFEFGMCADTLTLIDEVLTPDSSRFWPKSGFKPGAAQPSFDKQYVRDYLETLDWDKTPPGPVLPEDIIARTSQKYCDAYRLLTGKEELFG